MLRTPFVGVLTLYNLRFEGSIFLEKDTMGPVFGLFKREREYLRLHVSIIADTLFIVKLRFGRKGASAGCDFGQMWVLLKQQINRRLK